MSGGPRKPAKVVGVEPGLLDEEHAGAFLSRSIAWLRAMRQADISLIRRGAAPQGPAWIVINKSVFYRPDDLRKWITEKAVVRGVVSFDKRVGAVSAAPVPHGDGA